MSKQCKVLAGALMSVAVAVSSTAVGEVLSDTAGWQIERHPNGCSMYADFPEGTRVVFFRPADEREVVRVVLRKEGWQSLVVGQDYPIEVRVGRRELTGSANAVDSGTTKALAFNITKDQFFDIYRGVVNSFVVIYKGANLLNYGPSGAEREAVVATSLCLKSFDDPFSK